MTLPLLVEDDGAEFYQATFGDSATLLTVPEPSLAIHLPGQLKVAQQPKVRPLELRKKSPSARRSSVHPSGSISLFAYSQCPIS